ncbi:phage antirepressor N-terminal domain-containing protein [Acinetobacter gerneri]|jgi:hypothetical protein|uniref:phage antirepressor N-terminal domain-containing protein n=1 Tax=Acinetobacter gerneri TaxID=202952 RepID=UPI0023F4FF68|nr:phage antirepressor N-terminal domain-containing protein [Acinetobacter gerneri]MCH4245268.1 phage antirepressor N-terminal domain-containing protein [Acinetobacter gerneri]
MQNTNFYNINEMSVSFYESQLFIISFDGKPYIPMRPIVENMGLDWKSQHSKIKSRFSTCVVNITTQLSGDIQNRDHTCLPLNKLFGWLMTISPNKVKPELSAKIIRYQNECDDVLLNYWTAKYERKKSNFDEYNLISFDEMCSFQQGSIHSYGLLKRKQEKKVNNQRLKNWRDENLLQLDFGITEKYMGDK